MTNKETKVLHVEIPCYIDNFLSTLARETGMDRNDIALFFLCREAVHAQPNRAAKKNGTQNNFAVQCLRGATKITKTQGV